MTASDRSWPIGRRTLFAAAFVVCIALGALFLWVGREGFDRKQLSEAMRNQLPALPDTGEWPVAFERALSDAVAEISPKGSALTGLKELAMLYHANAFTEEAKICYQLLEKHEPDHPRWVYFPALLSLDQGDLAAGETLLVKAMARDPDYLPLVLKLGDVRFKSGQPKAALEAYRKCLLLDAKNPQALFGVVREQLRRGENNDARFLLVELLQAVPDFGPGHMLMAQLLDQIGDSRGAEESRKLGKDHGPYSGPADPWLEEMMERCYDADRLVVLADQYFIVGRFDDAFRTYNRAATLSPDLPTVPLIRGFRLAELGNLRAAVHSFEAATQLGGDTTIAYAELSGLHRKLQEYPKAIDTVRRGLDENPASARLHTSLGELLLLQGEKVEAVGHFHTALQLDPSRVKAIKGLAQALWDQGLMGEAIDQLLELRRLSPSDIYSRSTLAEYYFARGELEKAEAFVREAWSLRPHDPHLKRAMLDFLKTYGDQLAQQEEFSDAIQYCREALALNPDWAELYHNLALVYANMENWKEAQGVLNTHLARRPQDAESRLVLGDIFWAAGDFSEARVHWRKARKLARNMRYPAGLVDALEARLQQPEP